MPQAVAHIKTGYKSSLYYAKPGQIPQYGANISGQIRVKFPRTSRGGSGATLVGRGPTLDANVGLGTTAM